MERIFDKWKKALDDFKKSVNSDLEEIRRCKAEVQMIRTQMSNEFNAGKYIRDPNRIILSAPEIIIGNVDSNGELMNMGGSIVVIRGREVSLQGCSEGGRVEIRAPRIQNSAVDPGTDGQEEVVGNVSEIISQAKVISMQANDDENVFSSPILLPTAGGLLLHADKSLTIDASLKSDSKKKEIEDLISMLENSKTTIEDEVDESKTRFEALVNQTSQILDQHDKLMESEVGLRSNFSEMMDLNDQFSDTSRALYEIFADYSKNISHLAEITRKISKLKETKDKIKTGDDFIKNSTGSSLDIRAEKINLANIDGEGNIRENPGVGVSIITKNFAVNTNKQDGSLIDNGSFIVSAQNISLNTFDRKNEQVDESGKMTSGDYAGKGKINLRSKTVNIEGYDYEIKENKFTKKNLAKEGKLSVGFENIDFSTNECDGKAVGEISMNSKSISLESMDVDKDNGTEKTLTAGGSMLLLSEKMFIGSKDKDTESKLVQTAADTVGIFAKTTYEVQQGENPAVLQMDGGKMELSGETTGIYGKTTINDDTEIKGDLKAPKASIDNIEAKSSFTSPNISDGMATGGGGGGGSLSPKLQKEDAPKEKNNS